MRILFLTENFPPEVNAAATRVYERARYWRQWGHDVTIITSNPNFPQGNIYAGWSNRWYCVQDYEGLRVVRVKTYIAANEKVLRRTLDFVSFMLSGFVASLFQPRPDVVVATSPQFFTAVAGWLVGAVRRVPFVFELGDLWPASIVAVGALRSRLIIRVLEFVELFLYRRAAAVVALTSAFKQDLIARGIAKDKIAVVRNGVDLARYRPQPRDEALAAQFGLRDKFVVGYIGTIGMAHGLRNVLNAAELCRDRPEIAFMLVGPGAEREVLVAEAASRGLSNVFLPPPQPKDRMPAVWSICDLALVHLRDSPTFADVIPSKMFEAMAMAKPVLLAIPKGEASAILEADGAGMHVKPDDAPALAQAVTMLCNNADLRRRFAAAASDAAKGHTRERQAREMEAVLDCVQQGEGARAGRVLTG